MIARVWHGSTRPADADRYLAHLNDKIFPGLRALAGHAGAWVLRRPAGDTVAFIVMTMWESREAIQAFSGPDIDLAVVPPDAQALLASWDPHATHYDVVAGG